jgi:hypothetical protein
MALLDLGNIHYKYGYNQQAVYIWEKAFESSSNEDDQRKIIVLIMRAAFSS